jgi:hypothetical protein
LQFLSLIVSFDKLGALKYLNHFYFIAMAFKENSGSHLTGLSEDKKENRVSRYLEIVSF